MAQLPSDLESAPNRPMDQQLGLDLTTQNQNEEPQFIDEHQKFWKTMTTVPPPGYFRAVADTDPFGFLAFVDVHHFASVDLSVTIDDDEYVVIKGKHKEKTDEHGHITREFTRRYYIPEDCDLNTVESEVSSDGVLVVFAKKYVPVSNDGQELISNTEPMRMDVRDETAQQIIRTGGAVQQIMDTDCAIQQIMETDGADQQIIETDGAAQQIIETDGAVQQIIETDGAVQHIIRTDGAVQQIIRTDGAVQQIMETDGADQQIIETDGDAIASDK